jgi:hypothetical protein
VVAAGKKVAPQLPALSGTALGVPLKQWGNPHLNPYKPSLTMQETNHAGHGPYGRTPEVHQDGPSGRPLEQAPPRPRARSSSSGLRPARGVTPSSNGLRPVRGATLPSSGPAPPEGTLPPRANPVSLEGPLRPRLGPATLTGAPRACAGPVLGHLTP